MVMLATIRLQTLTFGDKYKRNSKVMIKKFYIRSSNSSDMQKVTKF